MFYVSRVHGMMSTDTMDSRYNSIHAEKYLQLFSNNELFVEAYPIKRKADCHEGLNTFIHEYGAMERLIYDGDPEHIRRKKDFQCIMQKYDIRGHIAESEISSQNPFEGCIRELRRGWLCTMFQSYCPQYF